MIDFSKIEKYRENNRIEAKKAIGGLPHSIWETYSAFANTLGGIILLGVEEHKDKSLHPVDLPDPEGLILEFWALVNDKRKVSANILSEKDVTIETADGKRIVAIRVPRAQSKDRPVYIDGDLFSGSYRRNGEGDYRLTAEQISKIKLGRITKTIAHKRIIVIYLTKHICASRAKISELLGLKQARTRQILSEMISAGIIVAEGGRKNRVYRLKA